ncbi:MAG: nicotinate-nucleotide adenylyltransferase, partial [Cyanobacteria bacterium RYN_339]|nr:nicotinate-nucleotide adenylyltransferase [Cyanobacteria bacterium RYN_339]
TFDPIHAGHLAAAHAVLDGGWAQEVIFVPAGIPPHKPAGARVDAAHRWCMTVMATLDEPRFRVARWEVDRDGPTFAIDTLEIAHQELVRGPVELAWVIGTDAMALIHTWRDAPRLFDLARFLVVARADFDEAGLRAELGRHSPWAPYDKIAFVPMPLVDVSSTAIRAHLAQGEPAPGLCPLVATYIHRYGLYRQLAESVLS